MKVYKGVSASPGLVLGQVSRLEHHVETFSHGPFNPERELRLLANTSINSTIILFYLRFNLLYSQSFGILMCPAMAGNLMSFL